MNSEIAFGIMKDCINNDSFGEICVRCNACGRFSKETQKQDALNVYKKQLQEEYEFDNWFEGIEQLQKKNVKANIEYFKSKIAELEEVHNE